MSNNNQNQAGERTLKEIAQTTAGVVFLSFGVVCKSDGKGGAYGLRYEDGSALPVHPTIPLEKMGFFIGEATEVLPVPVDADPVDLTDPANAGFIGADGYVSYRTPWGVASFHYALPAGADGGFWRGEHFKADDCHARRAFSDGSGLITADERRAA